MTETDKNSDQTQYWNALAQKGKVEHDLKQELDALFLSYDALPISHIFKPKTCEFNPLFLKQITTQLDEICSKFQNNSIEKDVPQKKELFMEKLRERLDLIHNKKVLCRISFPSYPLYKFFDAFDTEFDEVEFRITEDHILINQMDPSRICIVNALVKNDTFEPFRTGKLGINMTDLKKITTCQSADNATTTLTFSETMLYITIVSKKYDATIRRTLGALDLDMAEVPLTQLYAINYPCQFFLLPDHFSYSLKNLEIYSEVVNIDATADRVIFSEAGQIGEGTIEWKKGKLQHLSLDFDAVQQELAQNGLEEDKKAIIRKMIQDQMCSADYSMTFLKWLDKLGKILKKDTIDFSLRNNHPLKATLKIRELGETEILYFLAPRTEEAEFEEDEEESTDEIGDF